MRPREVKHKDAAQAGYSLIVVPRDKAAVVMILLLLSTACTHSSPSAEDSKPSPAAVPSDTASLAPDSAPSQHFNASRAMEYVKEIVAFGPRPLGSEGHKKAENYILGHLKGDNVERDDFEITTAEGRFPVHNIVAKYPGKKDGIIVIASHYDTNWPLRKVNYIGANDGGSSSGVLLEIANQLRGKKREGYSIWPRATRHAQPSTHNVLLAAFCGGLRRQDCQLWGRRLRSAPLSVTLFDLPMRLSRYSESPSPELG